MIKLSPTKIKSLFYGSHYKSLPNYLNLWSIEDNAVIGVDMQISAVYELSLPDLIHKSEIELDNYFNMVKTLLHGIPENVTIQFWVQSRLGDRSKIKEYTDTISNKSEFSKYIVEDKVNFINGLQINKLRYYMYVTTYPDNAEFKKLSFNLLKLINSDYKKHVIDIHESRIKRINEICTSTEMELNNLSIKYKRLKNEEIYEVLYKYLNPGRSEFHDFNKINPERTLRSQIVFNAVENNFDSIYTDGYYFRTINLHIRPESIGSYNLINFLGSIDPEYDFSLAIHSIPQEPLIKDLQLNSTLAGAISTMNPFKKYYEAELMSQHARELIEHVKTTYQRLYYVSFNIVVRETTLEKLTKKTNSIVSAYRSLSESEGVIDDMNHLFNFLAVLPNNSHFNTRKHIFHTEAVARLMPLHSTWKGTKESKMLLITRTNELLGLDLFDSELPAKHSLVAGQTGSGKSFFTNYLLANFFIESENNHIICIDIGGSYRKLCSLLGGEYLEVDQTEKYSFNPFPLKEVAIINNTKEKFEIDPDIMSYIRLLLIKMICNDRDLSGEEALILDESILNTYKNTTGEVPILSNLVYQLQNYDTKDPETKKLATKFSKDLDYWTKGGLGTMFNRPTTIRPDARIIVYDLQKLQAQKDIQEVVFFMIQNVIWGKLQNKALKKCVVFDECWKFFGTKSSAELIENLYRTARKFNAMILSITQSPEDFFNSSAAGAVLANSYVKYFLKISKGIELLNSFQLNPEEIKDVASLTSIRRKYSEIFVKFNNDCQVLRVYPSKAEYWVCTTDAEDFQKEMAIKEAKPGITEVELLKELAGGG